MKYLVIPLLIAIYVAPYFRHGKMVRGYYRSDIKIVRHI